MENLVIFDGICNLCNSTVIFIIQNDKKPVFKFAPLQSPLVVELFQKACIPVNSSESIALMHKDKVYYKSTAVLKIMKQLGGGYPLLYALIVIPPFIRDFFYDIVAKNRYRWFGKKETCMVPSEEIKSRFI